MKETDAVNIIGAKKQFLVTLTHTVVEFGEGNDLLDHRGHPLAITGLSFRIYTVLYLGQSNVIWLMYPKTMLLQNNSTASVFLYQPEK